jgi:hypothetical protein
MTIITITITRMTRPPTAAITTDARAMTSFDGLWPGHAC